MADYKMRVAGRGFRLIKFHEGFVEAAASACLGDRRLLPFIRLRAHVFAAASHGAGVRGLQRCG